MRHANTTALAVLVMLSLAAPLCGREQGDFTPRGALLHARLSNLQSNLKRLGGSDDYLAVLERMWTYAPKRDAENMQPMLDEIRSFIKSAQSVEFALGDIMVREPYTQTISIIELAEGAPEQFSEALRNWAKVEFGKKAVIEPKAMDIEVFHFRRYPGMLVITSGEGMLKHVEDVLAGNLEDSLSQVKRFKDWREKAKGDVVAFADMKAWRNCIDRLGREVDREFLDVMGILEWQKWDVLSCELDVPGASDNGLTLRADLTLTEPFGPLSAMIKSAGAFTLFDILPAETLGLIAAQLGNEHERTYQELLRFFHDTEWRLRHGSLERRIESYKRYAADALESAKSAENEEDKKRWQEQAEQYQNEVKELEAELASGKPRPFEANAEERERSGGRSSESERFHDDTNRALEEMGMTREEVFAILGNQAGAGIIGLPDPLPDDSDIDIFSEMWFIAARATGDIKAVKDKFIAALNKKRGGRESEGIEPKPIVGKPVEGGEMLSMGDGPVIFIGENIVGVAANTDVAMRILAASAGKDRMSLTKIPGGLPAGSKLIYVDVGEIIGRMLDGEKARKTRWGRPPAKMWDVRQMLRGGFRVCAFDMEYATRISLNLATGGETNLRSLLDTLADDLGFERAWRHDTHELESLGDACDTWFRDNRDELAKLKDGERKDKINAINMASLLKGGQFTPRDGMRSAFDPAMEAQFKEMISRRDDRLGGKEVSASDLTECGFDWFGLPVDEVAVRSEDDYGYGNVTDAWLVAATKGSWVSGGRACLVQSGLNFRAVWLSEDDYNALKLSNSSGGRLKTFKPKGERPLWKIKLKLKHMRWHLYDCASLVNGNLKQADGTFKEASFKGSDYEDAVVALREKFSAGEQFWLDSEVAKRLVIEVKEKGFKIRIEMDGQWTEMDENGNITNSWGNE